MLAAVGAAAACGQLNSPSSVTTSASNPGTVFMTNGGIPGGGSTMYSLESVLDTIEVSVQVALPRAGTLKSLFVIPSASPTAGAVMIHTVRVNGADTALTVTHTADTHGSSGVSNTSDSIAVSAGDKIAVKIRETSGTGPAVYWRATFLFQ